MFARRISSRRGVRRQSHRRHRTDFHRALRLMPLRLEGLEPRLLLSSDLFVSRLIAAGGVEHPFDRLEVQFSKPIQDGTFDAADISMGVLEGSPITPPVPSKLADNRYELDLSGLTGLDTYALSLGPDILDAEGVKMNQDHDSTPGEATDAYIATLFGAGVTIPGADSSYDGSNIVICGSTATIDGSHNFASVAVVGGAVVLHSPAMETAEYKLDWTITDSLWIDSDSSIDVTGRGYLAGRTGGNTTRGGATGGSGASYGGLGYSSDATTNAVYGDYHSPVDPGSGGGTSGSLGGSGGGVIKITAPLATIDGQILANGGGSTWGGGGSGGSILLNVGRLTGVGSIGAGGGGTWNQGAGGGGRVAVHYDDISGFDASKITALAGAGAAFGSLGTVYFKRNSDTAGELRVDSHGSPSWMYTPLGLSTDTAFHVDRLVVSGVGAVAAPEHEMPIVAGTVLLEKGGMLTHQAATEDRVYTLQLTVTGELVVGAESSIDVTGRGYLAGRTLGNTTRGGATGGSGGSYGGLGYSWDGVTNAVYGDYRNPVHPGSGGGAVGSGGGVIKIATPLATIDGQILANGGGSYSWGGGSGGSILLNVRKLTGVGSISAGGGGSADRAGGGGGRVAVYYDDFTGFDASRITALAGTGPGCGSTGTVYFKRNSDTAGELRVDSHGSQSWMYTPLGVNADTSFIVDRLVVSGVGAVAAPEHEMPIVARTVLLEKGGMLTHQTATEYKAYTLQLTVTGELVVDAESSIDVTGRGSSTGGATGGSGGSYGGRGYSWEGSTNAVYGDYRNPIVPGSGGGSGGSGGGVIKITTPLATIDGQILATGGGSWGWGGGSGGSILLNVGRLTGVGSISAGGGGSADRGAGGGGRVAVYTWSEMTLPTANITANGGSGASWGQPGSVFIGQTPYFVWSAPHSVLHGTETLSWTPLGMDPSQLTADITAYRGQYGVTLAINQPSAGNLVWDTRTVPDGIYEIHATFRGGSGQVVGQAVQEILLNNSVAWHGGWITADETWTDDQVHVVEGALTVAARVQLTIQPGSVVNFARGSQVVLQSGATVYVPATQVSPVVLTSLADDSAGGDTNRDGSRTQPHPGDWFGFAVVRDGTLDLSPWVDMRYGRTTHAGTLGSNETWRGSDVHYLLGGVLVPAGVTLTIQPGAVVKFDPSTGITVDADGALVADGTIASPITFTSVADDSVGGDTNGDGNATSPAAGDWRSIRLGGGTTGSLRYAEVRYGGNSAFNGEAGGTVESFGTLTVENSRIDQSLKDGILAAGLATVANSLVTGTDRGVVAWGWGEVIVLNSTVDDNRLALVEHGGILTVRNSIITNSLEAGLVLGWREDAAVTGSDVWNPGAINYAGTPDKTGQNGNISTDPTYKDRARGNYRLKYRSPAIDAADGPFAPAADFMGAPRYDDPRTPNTGTPVPGGTTVPDMGAFEFVETAGSDVDMVVTSVVGAPTAMAGQMATIQWTVANVGTGTVVGPWHDQVDLRRSRDPSVATFAAEVLVGEGVTLGPGQSFTASAQVRVPGDIVGNRYWQVSTNSRGDVFEGQNYANNECVALMPTALDLPSLAVGGALVSGQFAAARESQWFKCVPQAGQDVRIVLDTAAATGAVELYMAQGYVPNPEQFDLRQAEWNSPDASLVIASPSGQPYYLLAYAQSLEGAPVPFTIQASVLAFSVATVSPNRIGNSGPVTLKVEGGQLTDTAPYELLDPSGHAVTATSVFWVNSSTVYATFNLVGHPTGPYDVRVGGEGSPRVLSDAIAVVPGVPGRVDVHLITPNVVRAGRYGDVVVEYANVGDTDVMAPLMMLSVNAGSIVTEYGPSGRVLHLGIEESGPAGVLPPGAQGSASFRFQAPTVGDEVEFEVGIIANPSASLDWVSVQDAMRPPTVPADAWPAIFANFLSAVGSTLGRFNAVMAEDATYLSRLGQYTGDVDRLVNFELRQDGMDLISSRYLLGAFGRGMPAFWEISALTWPEGHVTLEYPVGHRTFWWNAADQQFVPKRGNTGTLTFRDECYRLVEKTGEVLIFRPDGKLDYVELPGGLRTVLSYAGGRVTGITDFRGGLTQIDYNAQGRVDRITEPDGVTTTCSYDLSNEHLLAAAAPSGTTGFTYVTGQGAAREHAVESVALTDGTRIFFEYDAQGRLIRQHRDGQAESLSHGYDSTATITQTDANEVRLQFSWNDFGALGRFTGALGETARMFYDANGNLTRVVAGEGIRYSAQYSPLNDLIQVTDPRGGLYQMRYGTEMDRLVSLTDSLGNSTSFEYDSAGQLAAQVYPDGSRETSVSNLYGDLTQWNNRRGQTCTFGYDPQGRPIHAEYADGSSVALSYDAHGNLLTVTDASGLTTFEYDAADRPIRIAYPTGRWLEYRYDAGGARTRMADSNGFAVNYAYDGVGRLARLADDGGGTIVAYSYDPAGRLTRKDLGNGTYTTYAYDASDNLLYLVNCAADGSVVSRFDYAYDTAGRRTAMATLDGQWTYLYDPGSQLVRAVFVSVNPSIPDQDLTYVYDAMGNRVQVVDAGTVTQYRTNNLNQCIQAGTATYAYDADGNLVAKTDGADAWSYVYDSQNRLVGATRGADTWGYGYDSLGNRVSTTHDGVTTWYLVDPLAGDGNVVAEYDDRGAVIAHYAHGLDLASRVAGDGTPAFYALDGLGSTSEVTGLGGSVLNRYAYGPFGRSLLKSESLANPFQFVGGAGVMTEPNDLVWMRARFYDPGTGRFVQQDPIGLAGGLNLYRYAGNDPVGNTDPSGLMTLQDVLGFFKWLDALRPNPRGWQTLGEGLKHYGRGPVPSGYNGVVKYAKDLYARSEWIRHKQYIDKLLGRGPGAQPAQGFVRALLNAARPVVGGIVRVVLVPAAIAGAVWALAATGFYVAGRPDITGSMMSVFTPTGWRTAWNFYISKTRIARGLDPNDMIGPTGIGDPHFVPPEATLPYTIRFENMATANAAAQEVTVTHALRGDLDWSTFQVQSLGFAGRTIEVPASRQNWGGLITVDTDPNPVRIDVSLDTKTGVVTWHMASEDPVTRALPEDPWAGFLPPNNATHRGEGYVTFTVRPKAGLATGAEIRNQASIVFDVNPAIPTNEVFNTIDSGSPTSAVAPLPPEASSKAFAVNWSGEDDAGGSGIAAYNVYVSTDGGDYILWLERIKDAQAVYRGQSGHTYALFSTAADNVGNTEAPRATPDAQTTVPLGSTAIWSGAGADSLWSTADNWCGTPVVDHDRLSFSGTVGLHNENDRPDRAPVSGIIFQNDAGEFVLDGDPLGLAGDITNLGPNTQTIYCPLVLLGAGRAINAASGELQILGDISDNGADFGIIKNGVGRVILSGYNTYTGGTTVETGALEITSADSLPTGGALTIGAGGTVVLSSGLGVATASGTGKTGGSLLAASATGTTVAVQSSAQPSAPTPQSAPVATVEVKQADNCIADGTLLPQLIVQPATVLPAQPDAVLVEPTDQAAIVAAAAQPSIRPRKPTLGPTSKNGQLKASDAGLKSCSVKRAVPDLSWVGFLSQHESHTRSGRKAIAANQTVDEVLARFWE